MFLAPKIAGGNTGATANIVTLFREGVGACQAQLWPSYGESWGMQRGLDLKSTRLNSSHLVILYAVFCLKKKNEEREPDRRVRRRADGEARDEHHRLSQGGLPAAAPADPHDLYRVRLRRPADSSCHRCRGVHA